jgi:putative hydrolase of the HAD superfamily
MSRMPIAAIAFDLGNTLVEYYDRADFSPILSEAVCNAYAVLAEFASAPLEEAQAIAVAENHEQPDGQVRPLFERLERIFQLAPDIPVTVREGAVAAFMRPIFRCARRYDDTIPVLRALRARGYRLAVVSNTPCGSPAPLWREELRRLEIFDAVDASIFCVDIGWRKPAARIFQRALEVLQVPAEECLFVGDEPEWDVLGARNAGLPAVLIDRNQKHLSHQGARIEDLRQLDLLLNREARTGAGQGNPRSAV